MGWLGSIFGEKNTDKVVDTGTDIIKRGMDAIDALFYTDEEKDSARMKWFELVLSTEKDNKEQGSIRSITRRQLARDVFRVYLFLILAAVVVFPVNKEWTAFIIEIIKILSFIVAPMTIFFFGSYGYGTYVRKKG